MTGPDLRVALLVPTWAEYLAVRRVAAPPLYPLHTGGGRAASRPDRGQLPALVGIVLGVGGALTRDLEPGQVVVGEVLLTPDRARIPLPAARTLRRTLADAGLPVVVGGIAASGRLATGPHRRRLAASDAVAVDTESHHLRRRFGDRVVGVVRVIVDGPDAELWHPGILMRGTRGLRTLGEVARVLRGWAEAVSARRVLLASPRSFCAGVERAIDIVERALARFGPPIYVRHAIVHNTHVVEGLRRRGVVFVEDESEVPSGAVVVFSAHGSPPEAYRRARERGLTLIDATCPLVTKVHVEARRHAEAGRTVVVIGHADHQEVIGTVAEVPDRSVVVGSVEDVERLDLPPDAEVAYVTQTTLSVEDTADIVAALARRFPRLVGPAKDDICYATQNRQDAVRVVARRADVVLVVGSVTSSNSARLVEVAGRAGARAYLIDRADDIDPRWLVGATTVGVTAGASAPDVLVDEVLHTLAGLGPTDLEEIRTAEEHVSFALPREVS